MIEQPRPKVSVIVCTHNRPRGLQRAIDSVLSQVDIDLEIIVVDDGSDPPAQPLANPTANLRTIRTEHRGVGSARSVGLEMARGEFTAYCDDDDRWEPNHLGTLLQYLVDHPEVDLVYGDSATEWVDGSASVVDSIHYDSQLLAEYSYISAGDVLHRTRAARDAGSFDSSLASYEDWDLWLRMSLTCTLRHLPEVTGRRFPDGNCVSSGDRWRDWRKVYEAHQERLRDAGNAGRHGLIVGDSGPVRFDPQTWKPGNRKLSWHSLLRPNEGYGSVGRQLLLALERQGVELSLAATNDQPSPGFERFYERGDSRDRLGFYYHYWAQPGVLSRERIINYSMWESTQVPKDHVEEINKFVALQYVPCRQNLESFRECGVRAPMKVLHHGVDSSRFPRLIRQRRDHFTFGTFGDLSPRKGIDVLLRAFCDEFARDEPARLLMKSSSPALQYAADDPRITLISGYLDGDGLLDILGRMDAFVLPSRGEGFGLCGLEAMATGLPLIATGWSGPAEYLDPEFSYPLDYRLAEAGGVESNHVRYHGLWAEPDYEHLRHLMRHLFEHPDEASRSGKLAAERVREHWSWDRVASQMCRDLDQLARS